MTFVILCEEGGEFIIEANLLALGWYDVFDGRVLGYFLHAGKPGVRLYIEYNGYW